MKSEIVKKEHVSNNEEEVLYIGLTAFINGLMETGN